MSNTENFNSSGGPEDVGQLGTSHAIELALSRIMGQTGIEFDMEGEHTEENSVQDDPLNNAAIFSHPELSAVEQQAMINTAAISFVFGEQSFSWLRKAAKIHQNSQLLTTRVFVTLSGLPLRSITKGVELPGPPLIVVSNHTIPHQRRVTPTAALSMLAEYSLQEPTVNGDFAPELRAAIEHYRSISDSL